MQILFVLLLERLFFYVNPQKLFPGHCPPIAPLAGFNKDRYMGIWYQQATFKSILKDSVTCTHFRFSPMEDGGFRMEARKVARLTNGPVSVFGVAKQRNSTKREPGNYEVTLFGDLVNEVSSYHILYTNYKNISVVWTCDRFYFFWNIQNIQVLTRERIVNATNLLVYTLKALLPKHLDYLLDFLVPVDQTQCEEIVAQ